MKPHRLIFGRSQEIAAAVAKMLPGMEGGFGPCEAIGIVSADGRPLGGVVYHNYRTQYRTCQVGIATMSPLWAQPTIIADILAIPFDQYKCQLVEAYTPSANERAQRFLYGIGMKRDGVLRHRFGRGKHAWVFSMTDTQYATRWRRRREMKEAA